MVRPIARLGAVITNEGRTVERLGLDEMARVAEDAGAETLCVSDHLLTLDRPARYPGGGDLPEGLRQGVFEALSCCAFMAAATKRARLATGVLVLPQRNVLELAKVVATIDRLSGGRLVLGVGAGWYEAEMAALGYDFATRGIRFDEMLEVLRSCWSGRPAPFSGEQVSVPADVVLRPRPSRDGGPPLLIGGMSNLARRRASRLGDGWIGVAQVATLDLDAQRDLLRHFDQERRTRSFEVVVKLHAASGEAERLPAAVAGLASIGFDEVIVEPPWDEGLEAVSEILRACRVSHDGADA